jgi:hypothetical protein
MFKPRPQFTVASQSVRSRRGTTPGQKIWRGVTRLGMLVESLQPEQANDAFRRSPV